MTAQEPIFKKSPAAASLPLNADGPIDLLSGDWTHIGDLYFKKFSFGDGLVQGTYPIFIVGPGTIVWDVDAYVLVAFTTSVTLTIGDGNEAAGYLASADIVPQTIDTVSRSAAGGEAYALGHGYTAGDTIDLVVGGADIVVGELFVAVRSVDVNRFSDTVVAA